MVTIVICVIAFLIGITLLTLSGKVKKEPWLTLIREVGAVFLALSVLSAAWDFAAKRAFTEEILRQLHVSQQMETAGVTDITTDFMTLSWDEYFHGARELDAFFVAASSWEFTNHQRLHNMLKDPRTRIRFVLPDFEHPNVTGELALRWNTTEADTKKAIVDVFGKLKALASEPGAVGHVEIWLIDRAPLYTYYRLDNVAVFVTYNNSRSQQPVPAFVCRRPGSLFGLLEHYFDEMTSGVAPGNPPQKTTKNVAPLARRVFVAPQ